MSSLAVGASCENGSLTVRGSTTGTEAFFGPTPSPSGAPPDEGPVLRLLKIPMAVPTMADGSAVLEGRRIVLPSFAMLPNAEMYCVASCKETASVELALPEMALLIATMPRAWASARTKMDSASPCALFTLSTFAASDSRISFCLCASARRGSYASRLVDRGSVAQQHAARHKRSSHGSASSDPPHRVGVLVLGPRPPISRLICGQLRACLGRR
eukprot:116333-Prorocentrum_minimum.AAC.6